MQREHGQRALGQCVLQTAPNDDARTEHARDADRVDEAESREQHEQLEAHEHGPRIGGSGSRR